MTMSMPRCAAASAALAGTAVGSGLGCQAQVQHEFLAPGVAQLLLERQRVGKPLAGMAAHRFQVDDRLLAVVARNSG